MSDYNLGKYLPNTDMSGTDITDSTLLRNCYCFDLWPTLLLQFAAVSCSYAQLKMVVETVLDKMVDEKLKYSM